MRPASVSDRGDAAVSLFDVGDRHALDDLGTELSGALRHGHGAADGIGSALVGHVEAGEQVVGSQQRPHVGDLTRRDLGFGHAEPVLPGTRPTEHLDSLGGAGDQDVPDLAEAGGVTGLGLEARVQVARIAGHEQRGLVGHAGRGDQPGRVPGGACGEGVPLEQHDVGPPEVGQVVRDAAADDAAADDDDAGTIGHGGSAHGYRTIADRRGVCRRRAGAALLTSHRSDGGFRVPLGCTKPSIRRSSPDGRDRGQAWTLAKKPRRASPMRSRYSLPVRMTSTIVIDVCMCPRACTCSTGTPAAASASA